MTQKNTLLNYLTKRLEFMEYYNRMSPFNLYDSEYVDYVKTTIKQMKEKEIDDYDIMPVVACTYCNSLHIQVDEVNNDHCMQCGSINEITVYKDIDTYLEAKEIDDN